MPTYEYRCANGHSFEAFQSMTDDPLDACRVCDAQAERILSPVAIHFKGSGFYATDYARKGGRSSGNGSDPAKKDEKKSESSDSKSKAKTES